jgi:hypothetical protein
MTMMMVMMTDGDDNIGKTTGRLTDGSILVHKPGSLSASPELELILPPRLAKHARLEEVFASVLARVVHLLQTPFQRLKVTRQEHGRLSSWAVERNGIRNGG